MVEAPIDLVQIEKQQGLIQGQTYILPAKINEGIEVLHGDDEFGDSDLDHGTVRLSSGDTCIPRSQVMNDGLYFYAGVATDQRKDKQGYGFVFKQVDGTAVFFVSEELLINFHATRSSIIELTDMYVDSRWSIFFYDNETVIREIRYNNSINMFAQKLSGVDVITIGRTFFYTDKEGVRLTGQWTRYSSAIDAIVIRDREGNYKFYVYLQPGENPQNKLKLYSQEDITKLLSFERFVIQDRLIDRLINLIFKFCGRLINRGR